MQPKKKNLHWKGYMVPKWILLPDSKWTLKQNSLAQFYHTLDLAHLEANYSILQRKLCIYLWWPIWTYDLYTTRIRGRAKNFDTRLVNFFYTFPLLTKLINII